MAVSDNIADTLEHRIGNRSGITLRFKKYGHEIIDYPLDLIVGPVGQMSGFISVKNKLAKRTSCTHPAGTVQATLELQPNMRHQGVAWQNEIELYAAAIDEQRGSASIHKYGVPRSKCCNLIVLYHSCGASGLKEDMVVIHLVEPDVLVFPPDTIGMMWTVFMLGSA